MTDQQQTEPQDAFAELARITLADHSLDSVMARIAVLAKTTLGLNFEVSVTLVERGKPLDGRADWRTRRRAGRAAVRPRLRAVPGQHRRR